MHKIFWLDMRKVGNHSDVLGKWENNIRVDLREIG